VELRAARFTLAISLSATLACGTSDPLAEQCPANSVVVSVSSSTTPEFTWSPACPVGGLTVTRLSDNTTVWSIFGQRIAPTVRYGVTPELAGQTKAASPLAAGEQYVVTLSRSFLVDGAVQICGSTGFTP
jgi:hypothetical protein